MLLLRKHTGDTAHQQAMTSSCSLISRCLLQRLYGAFL